jgi:CMP-N-acetylneuraminic acid synthetase
MTTIAALVPMRHHSQRVPGKNYRLLAGKPLYHYIVESLLAVPDIGKVIVDTDSEPILEGLQQYFPSVMLLRRPEQLRADTIPMNEILLYDTDQVAADFYLQTHSTNPLLKPKTITRAIQIFLQDFPTRDSLFSVTRLQTRLWDQSGRPLNHNPEVLLQTQDLPPVFEENSCLYIFTRESLQRRRNRLGDRPMMFEISAKEAWDIDDELDFAVTEFLMRKSENE